MITFHKLNLEHIQIKPKWVNSKMYLIPMQRNHRHILLALYSVDNKGFIGDNLKTEKYYSTFISLKSYFTVLGWV